MTAKSAADGLIHGFEKIVPYNYVNTCALYACERILGQYAQVNKDGTDNLDWKFWLDAYNYLKSKS